VSKRSRPPVDPDAVRGLPKPSAHDRDRIRENIDRAVSRGAASPTVLRVDSSMAERALGAAPGTALYGSKLAIAKVVIPAVLIGAGVGAIWARTLFAPHAPAEPVTHSLPVHVEDLDDDDQPLRTTLAAEQATNEPLVFEVSPPAAASTAKPVHHAKPHQAHPHTVDSRAAHSAPAATPEPPPVVAATEASPADEGPAHHLAEELRLMRAASAALSANDIPRTLNLLSEHAERFPEGALREERRALRVISLCKQGRSHFALVERDEFLSSSPRSPLTARVREACESSK
jgi:hypothetical protein